jgi:hypothetical protein
MVFWFIQGDLAGPPANLRLSDYDCGQHSGETGLAQGCRPALNLILSAWPARFLVPSNHSRENGWETKEANAQPLQEPT